MLKFHEWKKTRSKYMDLTDLIKTFDPDYDDFIGAIGGYLYKDNHVIELDENGTFYAQVMDDYIQSCTLIEAEMWLYIHIMEADLEDKPIIISEEEMDEGRYAMMQNIFYDFLADNRNSNIASDLIADKYMRRWATWQDFTEWLDDEAVAHITKDKQDSQKLDQAIKEV